MEPSKKWNMVKVGIFVLMVSLALTAYTTSPAFAGRNTCGEGWMTGGGSIFATTNGAEIEYFGQGDTNGRVTHGFVVHCTPRNSDNLEIVDHSTGLNFHLLNLTFTSCDDDPEIVPNPPDAGFDTFYGEGVGRCKRDDLGKQWQTCIINFTFTDGGERGGCIRDTAEILIQDIDGTILLNINGDVDCGNHQAHDSW